MYIDTHLHLDEPWLKGEEKRQKIVNNINQNFIVTFAQSCDIPSYKKILEYSKLSDYIFPSFGILPWYAHQYKDRFDEVENLSNEAIMLGEIGLDEKNARDKACIPYQRPLFNIFLEVAEKKNLIMNLHFRGTENEGFELLKSYNLRKPIFHSYSGSSELMKKINEEGFYYSLNPGINSIINMPKARRTTLEENIRNIPDELLLLEIDVLEGSSLPSTVFTKMLQSLSIIRQTTPEEIEKFNQKNVLTLVNDDSRLAVIKNLLLNGPKNHYNPIN